MLSAPAVAWLPDVGDARGLLGILLGAQAAITALTLAVMLFVLQASARRDADDRVYQEYIRQSRARLIFWGSIGAVGTTGVVLLAVDFGARGAPLLGSSPGLPNLLWIGPLAFLANLSLSLLVFEKAIPLAGPDRWQAMRLGVFKSDIRTALRLERLRATTVHDSARMTTEPFLGPSDRPADLSIQALMDDARRAMDERRQGDFERALDAVIDLLEYAMDEIERAGLAHGSLGSTPQWPPLRGLADSLAPFAEVVIQEGNRENVFGLLRLDYWLLSRGLNRRSGDLFTLAVESYRRNYEIAAQTGDQDLREILRDRLWQTARFLVLDLDDDLLPYARWMLRQQERLLSYALHADLAADFESLHREFVSVLASMSRRWDVRSWRRPHPLVDEHTRLAREYRIAIMGLGGRAALLAPERIADADRYMEVARREHGSLRQLADDLAQALSREDRQGYSLWSDWEMEGAASLEVRAVRPERYPLIFFSLRLLELAGDSAPTLNLRGRAQQVRDWFTANVDSIEGRAQVGGVGDIQRRRDFVLEALDAAVRGDELAADEEMIQRTISDDRVAAFTTGVYSSVFSANTIEQLFTEAGAAHYLPADAQDGPEVRGTRDFVSKGFLADEPDDASMHWAQLDGEEHGPAAESDLLQRLCRELAEVGGSVTSLDSLIDLQGALESALEELASPSEAIVVLGGEWSEVLFDTMQQGADGLELWWDLPPQRAGEIARYRGMSIIEGPRDGVRCLYVVEPGAWGCFVRAQVEGPADLLVEVDSISQERAEALLEANPDLFPDEPDEASKLRKIQTFVEVGVGGRTGFRVRDASRARKIIALPPAG